MNYMELLENSLKQMNERLNRHEPTGRLEFLADHVFDFTTYDSGVSIMFAKHAVEVIDAISNKKTFDYFKGNDERYKWYLIMVNMPFFERRLNWGGSIRGAWWDDPQPFIDSCGLYEGEDQLGKLEFAERNYKLPLDQPTEFEQFMKTVVEFAKPEMDIEDSVATIPLVKKEKKIFVQIGTGGHKVIESLGGKALVEVEPKVKNTLNAITPWLLTPVAKPLSEQEAMIYTQPRLFLKDGKEYKAYYGKRVTPTPKGELLVSITREELTNISTAGLALTNMLPYQISEIAFVEETSKNGNDDTPFATGIVHLPVLTGAGSNDVTNMVFYGIL